VTFAEEMIAGSPVSKVGELQVKLVPARVSHYSISVPESAFTWRLLP
jgi:hypothetical protein